MGHFCDYQGVCYTQPHLVVVTLAPTTSSEKYIVHGCLGDHNIYNSTFSREIAISTILSLWRQVFRREGTAT